MDGPPASFAVASRAHFGSLHAAFGQFDTSCHQRLANEVLDWLNASNTATDGTLLLPCEYMEVVAMRLRER